MFSSLVTALRTCNPIPHTTPGPIVRWVIIVRACVFSMTLTSGLVGVMLAWRDGYFSWILSILAILGLLIAHAANNVLNDLMDYRSGVDTVDYYRVQYSPHPIHLGWASPLKLFLVFLFLTLVDFIILIYFWSVRGFSVALFAFAGFLISATYVGGKFTLKFLGLGEVAVFIVWGPLMVGGTYLVMSGFTTWPIFFASIPYALLVTTVILGKHVDKLNIDQAKGIHTLPVLLGKDNAQRLVKLLIVIFYLSVVIESLWGIIPAASLLALLSIPRAKQVWQILKQPKPQEAPLDWPIWPLWYVGWCFHLVRLAGGWMLAGFFGQIVIEHLLR
jgi:1,4-dihydroxy-2-naphthoate polyprenyltransferase